MVRTTTGGAGVYCVDLDTLLYSPAITHIPMVASLCPEINYRHIQSRVITHPFVVWGAGTGFVSKCIIIIIVAMGGDALEQALGRARLAGASIRDRHLWQGESARPGGSLGGWGNLHVRRALKYRAAEPRCVDRLASVCCRAKLRSGWPA